MALAVFICALSVALPSVLHFYIHCIKTRKRENMEKYIGLDTSHTALIKSMTR